MSDGKKKVTREDPKTFITFSIFILFQEVCIIGKLNEYGAIIVANPIPNAYFNP